MDVGPKCKEVVLFQRLFCMEYYIKLECFWSVLCSEVCPLSECRFHTVKQWLHMAGIIIPCISIITPRAHAQQGVK